MKVLAAAAAILLAPAGWAQPFVISTFAGGGLPPLPASATSISIGAPSHPAIDSAGNVYFAGLATLFKLDRAGNLTRLAGNGRGGYSGDGGPAANAQISNITGLAVDSQGNVFFADADCNCVRKIDTSGNINLYAGNGTTLFSGDKGPATQAGINFPFGLAVDNAGNLYITDEGNNRIRKVSANDGTITTFAGFGPATYTGDGMPANHSALNQPMDVSTDGAGNVSSRIPKIAASAW